VIGIGLVAVPADEDLKRRNDFMDQLLAKLSAAAAAVQEAQNANSSVSTDDFPGRDTAAGHLAVAYEALAKAQQVAQG